MAVVRSKATTTDRRMGLMIWGMYLPASYCDKVGVEADMLNRARAQLYRLALDKVMKWLRAGCVGVRCVE